MGGHIVVCNISPCFILLYSTNRVGKWKSCQNGNSNTYANCSITNAEIIFAETIQWQWERYWIWLGSNILWWKCRHFIYWRAEKVIQDLHSWWLLVLFRDSCPTNIRIAKNWNKPHIGRDSHKLNLEVKYMLKNSEELKSKVGHFYDTMSIVRRKLKNRAMLSQHNRPSTYFWERDQMVGYLLDAESLCKDQKRANWCKHSWKIRFDYWLNHKVWRQRQKGCPDALRN